MTACNLYTLVKMHWVKICQILIFKYLSQDFSGDLLGLVKQKGVYPYEYIGSFKTLSEDKLPDKCKFFSSLKDERISEKNYSHAINVWNVFKMNTMSDYHDPCHFLISPG